MLPAWLVTDENWLVWNWNPLAKQLIEGRCPSIVPNLISRTVSIGEIDPPDRRCVSLWAYLFDLEKPQQQVIEHATRVMAQHKDILTRYREHPEPVAISELLVDLRSVQGVPGVVPYVYDRCDGENFLRIGIRIAPQGGLKLRTPKPKSLGHETDKMTHVEIALAYQVLVGEDKTRDRLTLNFEGSQPAIHDSTDRSRLEREVEQLRSSPYQTHALRTPLSNASSYARRLKSHRTDDKEITRLSQMVDAAISEADHLVRLVLLVSSYETLPVFARMGTDPKWPTITPEEIRHHVAEALMSVLHMRTDRHRDVQTIKRILEKHDIVISDEGNGVEVEDAFDQLASRLVSCEFTSFYLTASISSLRLTSYEAAILAKTVALQLVLTELVLNAVKHGDSKDPHVVLRCDLTNIGVCWTVENAISPAESPLSHQLQADPTSDTGRIALGQRLNQRATSILGWNLRPLTQQRAGLEAHRLFIPLKDVEVL